MPLIIFLQLIVVILSGLSTSYLQSAEPKTADIAAAYTSSLVTFISSLMFIVIYVVHLISTRNTYSML